MTVQTLRNTVCLPSLQCESECEADVEPAGRPNVQSVDASTLPVLDPGRYLLPYELELVYDCQSPSCNNEFLGKDGVAYTAHWTTPSGKAYMPAYFCSRECLLSSLHVSTHTQ